MRVAVGPFDSIPSDHCIAVAGGRAVVARVGDAVIAVQNRCLHQDSPLEGGRISGDRLTCPLHFWRYRLPEAEHTGGRGTLDSYPVEIVDGVVVVDLPELEPIRSLREELLAHAREWKRGDEDE